MSPTPHPNDRPWSKWALLFYALIALWTLHAKGFYLRPPTQLIQHDTTGYYAYLCLWWTDETIDFPRLQTLPYNAFTVQVETTTGDTVAINKYSTGVALLYTPFFWVAQLQAKMQALPRDGLSLPYRYWMVLGAVFYALLALLLLRAWLLQFFGEGAVTLALLGIGLGTNWWYYTLYAPLMPHHSAFVVIAALLYGSSRWYQTGAWKWAIWVGLCTGLLAAVRLPDLLVGWAILLGGAGSRSAWRQRWSFLWGHKAQIALIIGLAVLVQLPQIWYWHTQTGYYWLNTYAANGEGFFWGQPRLLEILVGYRKGWLIYTPMAFLCLWGLKEIYRQHYPWFWALVGYLLLQLYLISTWGCWWYGGSFGLRPMVESMALLSLPLAAFWEAVLSNKGWRRGILGSCFIFLVILNQLQCHQREYGIIHWDSMTRQAYWHAFGAIPPVSEDFKAQQESLLLHPDYPKESQRVLRVSTIW